MKRVLGPEELKYWFLDRRQAFNTVVGVRLAGWVNAAALTEVLPRFQASQALCGVAIVNQGRPRFAPIADVPVGLDVIERCGEQDWLAVMERELGRAFDVSSAVGPLVRLVLVTGSPGSEYARDSELFLVVHHALADALGAFTMLHDLLCLLGGGEITPRAGAPAFEELIPPECFSKPELAQLRERWWSRRVGEGLATLDWTQLDQRLQTVGATRLLHTHLAAERVAALAERCRAEDSTVHAAITAAALLGLGDVFPRAIKLIHSVSLRQRWEPPFGDSPGLCLSRVFQEHAPGPLAQFWDLARSARQDLLAAIEAGEPFDRALDSARMLEVGGEPMQEMNSDLTLTNPGRIPLHAEYGELKPLRVYGAGSVVVDGPVISTPSFGEGMSWLFCYPASWREAPRARSLSDNILRHLDAAIDA